MAYIYFVLCAIGLVLPYSQLIPFLLDNGLDFSLFWSQLFANDISSTFSLDLLISSVVFWIFLFQEGKKLQIKYLWIYVVCNLTIGLSFALPLFLWTRWYNLNKMKPISTSLEQF